MITSETTPTPIPTAAGWTRGICTLPGCAPWPSWSVTGVAFGAILLASAPAIVVLFALPITWSALGTLSFFADAAPWLDTRLALGPMPTEVMSSTQWVHAGTALGLWMLLPLLIGTWRITRREVVA